MRFRSGFYGQIRGLPRVALAFRLLLLLGRPFLRGGDGDGGRGELHALAQAVTVAFYTTVMGLLVGIVGFILGRMRRRWYDHRLDVLEASHGRA
jgi:hypothetical protein